MTAGSETSGPELCCARCGADLSTNPFASVCWLCGSKLDEHPELAKAVAARRPPVARVGSFSLASMLLFMTLASVVLGLVTIVPGFGIPLGVILFFVWFRTAAVVRRRALKGHEVTRGEKVVLFLQSFGTVIMLIMLTQIAAIAALFAACFVMLGTGAFNGTSVVSSVAMVAVGIAAVVGVITLWYTVIRDRFQRDTSDDFVN